MLLKRGFRDLIRVIYWRLRSVLIKPIFKFLNQKVYFGRNVQIIGLNKIKIGQNTTLGDAFWLNVANEGSKDKEKTVEIGSNCNFGRNNFVTVGESLVIKDYFFSSCYCSIVGASHGNSDPLTPYILSEVIDLGKGVNIGANVFMGAHSMILGSINVGFGSIIGAGTIVKDDVPPLSIVVGNPSKVIKRFCLKEGKWLDPHEIRSDLISEEEYIKRIKQGNPKVTMAFHAASSKMGWT